MYLLGIDLGSSSVKVSLVDSVTGMCLSSAYQPQREMPMIAKQVGWAEQEPEHWWRYVELATREVLKNSSIHGNEVAAIGISYQMHGLVLVDKAQKVLRPSIIWCDSRAAQIGENAFHELGEERCLTHLLNSPGNFTASKLKWVKDHEPHIYEKVYKVLLPGDFIALKLTGELGTTVSGLSEGIMWDFQEDKPAGFLLDHFGIGAELIPEIMPTFGEQGHLTLEAANALGLKPGTPVAYRAGDQPNNGFSLNVLQPGEIAATAGTSGVVYGLSEKVTYDKDSRVNTFAHVNHKNDQKRLGVLLCVNGSGILNSWMFRNIGQGNLSYDQMNHMASDVAIGSEGLSVLPFGNGVERMLRNQHVGSQICNLNFNIHTDAHLMRAAQEGIAFALKYGMDIMADMDVKAKKIKAGLANLFLSPVFRDTLAGITGVAIELYNTDGAQGAAVGAGVGMGQYASFEEAFQNLACLEQAEPDPSMSDQYEAAYANWRQTLDRFFES